MIGIYKIVNPEGKIFIGQSTELEKRFKHYRVKKSKRYDTPIRLSIDKFGHESHSFEVVKECSQCELDFYEQYYIKLYDSFDTDHGLNLQSGGKIGFVSSEKTKQKMSLKRKGIPGIKGIKPTMEALENRRIGRERVHSKLLEIMHSDEYRNKLKAKSSRPILMILGAKIQMFESAKVAAFQTGLSHISVSRYARKVRTHKHLKFEYI